MCECGYGSEMEAVCWPIKKGRNTPPRPLRIEGFKGWMGDFKDRKKASKFSCQSRRFYGRFNIRFGKE